MSLNVTRRSARRRGVASAARGFTLLEVIISTAILSLIVTIIWMSFSKMLEVRDRVGAVQDDYANMRIGLGRLDRELSMAYLSTHFSRAQQRTTTLFQAERDGQFYRLTFTSFGGMKLAQNANHTDTVVLQYFVRNDEETGEPALYRREIPRLVMNPRDVEQDYIAHVVCERISRLKLSFFDVTQNEWVDEWDTTGVEQANRLPAFVKIDFAVKNSRGGEIAVPAQVQLRMLKALDFGYRM